MGHTRPIWLARFFRCQSVGMWEQQFMNDPLTTSQLEAALALGQLACSPTVIPCLGRALRNHGAHPLVRSFSAQSLQRLHNDTSNFQSTDCLSLLLNYLYTYHYRSKASRGHFKALMENASPQAALPNPTTPRYASGQIGTAMSEDDEPMPEDTETAAPASPYMNMKHGPTATSGTPGQLLPRNPPFWMTSEMIFLRDLLTAIARLRSVDGKTVYESIDTLTQLLMHHTTDIPSKEQFNADYYIAHVISTLRHIRLAFTQCRVAVEDVARPALYRLLVSMGGPQATALHEAQRAWIHWRDDDMDSDAESLFLHVWRYYRLDHCLHSKHHVITCACLDVFSRSPMLRDLVRLKLCDETGSDFQLLAFLPLNLTPVLTQFGRWKEQHTAGSLDSVSAAVWSPYHTVSIGLLARHQLALVNALGSRDHRAAASCENTDIPGSPSCADGPALWYLMSAGVREIATSMRDQYCHYQDDNVERAALKSLLYCTAIGSLEPPLILLTRNAPVALCDIKTVEDLLVTLEWTCTTQYPASTLHARAMHQVTLLLQEGLKHQGVSVPAEQPMPGNGLLASSQPSIPLEQRNTNVSPAALESISRFLFCSRWTSPEEMDGLQRSGLSLLNAVILACRLDEVLTTPDTISHLVYIWDVFHEVLGDLLVDAPLVFIAYCMKPCRGLDDNGETQSTQQMYSAANGDTTSTSNSQPLFPPMYREERAQDFAPSQTAHSRISSSNALPIPQSESQQAADSGTFGSVHEKFLPQKKKKRRRRDHLDSYAAPQSSTVLDAAPAPVADDHSRSSHSPQYLQIKGLSTTFPATQWPKSYAVQPSHTFDSVPVAEPPASEEPSGDPHSFFQEGPSSPDAMLDADLGLDESTFSWDHRYNDEELFSGDPDSDWDTARTGPPRPEEPQRADPQCDYSSSGSFSASPGTQHSADLDSLLLRQPPTPFDDVPDTSSNADQRDPHSASVRSTLQFQHDVHTLRSPPDEHANDLSHLMVLTDGEISGDGGSHGDPEDFGVLDYGDALFISESPDFFPKDPGSPGHEFQADDIFGADEDPPHHDASPFTSYLQPAPVVLDDYAPQRVSQDGIGTAFGTSGAPPQGLPRNDLPPPPAAPGDGPTPAPQHYVYGRPLPFPPSVLCAKALWEYMQDRALRLPSVAEQRLSGVRHVYAFLFGVGLPQCLAFIHDHIQTPDPLLVDTFNANLKHGRYLRKLCLFQKRYLEDDSPEVPDWQTLAMEIVELLMSLPLASAFIDEVNHEEAPNYRAIVKEPMWLRLVQQKLQAQAYGSYHEWKNDLFLIFRNCRIFNAPESKIVQDCEALQTIVYSVLRPTEKLLSRWKATPSSPTPWGHPTDPSAC